MNRASSQAVQPYVLELVKPQRGSLPGEVVTLLFTDIEGSTRLWERDPAAMRAALARHDALLRQAITAQSGHIFKTIGDAFCAAFATPAKALAAAWAAQRALLAEDWGTTPVRVRMAIHSGEVEVRDADYFGPPLNRVARILAAGHGGQILVSRVIQEQVGEYLPSTMQLRDLGEHRLRDLSQPERIFQVIAPELETCFPPLRSSEAFTHNLPNPLTRFIGRERELAEIKRLLRTTRLLTLAGVGGTGKTRLAIQTAAEVVDEFANGVWLIELAPVLDPALLPRTIIAMLGVREEPGRPLLATLVDYLRTKRLLLILDNCEHLIQACAELAASLLQACPQLQILATSREALGISGEIPFHTPSMSLPDPRHMPPAEELWDYEALRLFADRARTVQPGFRPTPQNAPVVAQICARLDGIPLAIELAAARVRSLPVEQIAARLHDRFRLLTGGSRAALPRQQTLRALIDWSYDLLGEEERTVLRQLSVFAGGWTLEAAEAVWKDEGGAPQGTRGARMKDEGLKPVPFHPSSRNTQFLVLHPFEILDILTRLVDKSLVLAELQESEMRYRMLETIRQYAREKLIAAGEAEQSHTRHLEYFLRFAEHAEPELWRAEQNEWLDRLETENDNLRAALEWSQAETGWMERETADRQPSTAYAYAPTPNLLDMGLRLAVALGPFWLVRGYWSEGRAWLKGLLDIQAAATNGCIQKVSENSGVQALACSVPNQEQAKALSQRDASQYSRMSFQTQPQKQVPSADRTRPIKTAEALNLAGFLAENQGELTTAQELYEQSLAIGQEANSQAVIAYALFGLGSVTVSTGDPTVAQSLLEQSVNLFRALGDQPGLARALGRLGALMSSQGHRATARALYRENMAICRELGHRLGLAGSLIAEGSMDTSDGNYVAARAALEESLAIFREAGDKSGVAGALAALAHVNQLQGNTRATAQIFEECLVLFRELGNRPGVARTLNGLGEAARTYQDYVLARTYYEESLRVARELDQKALMAIALHNLGYVALHEKAYEQARSYFGQSLSFSREVGNEFVTMLCVGALAGVLGASGESLLAARLLGAMLAQVELRDQKLEQCDQLEIDRAVAAVQAQLDETTFTTAWAEGRGMSLEQAVGVAMEG